MIIEPYKGKTPRLAPDVFVAPGAVIIGDVTIGEGSSIWYNTVVRGDVGRVVIGKNTNIQDLCMLHMTTDVSDLIIGDEVTVGHRVVLHGCTIQDRCLIGMGAVILDNAVIGGGSVVAFGRGGYGKGGYPAELPRGGDACQGEEDPGRGGVVSLGAHRPPLYRSGTRTQVPGREEEM